MGPFGGTNGAGNRTEPVISGKKQAILEWNFRNVSLFRNVCEMPIDGEQTRYDEISYVVFGARRTQARWKTLGKGELQMILRITV